MLPHFGGRQMVQIWWRTGLNSQGHKSNQSVFHASFLQWVRVSLLYVRGYSLFAIARVLHASGLREEFHNTTISPAPRSYSSYKQGWMSLYFHVIWNWYILWCYGSDLSSKVMLWGHLKLWSWNYRFSSHLITPSCTLAIVPCYSLFTNCSALIIGYYVF